MTDQLLSSAAATSEEQSPSAIGDPACCSVDGYQTEDEADKPVILELGTTPNANSSYSTDFPLDMHLGSNSTAFLLSSQSYGEVVEPTQSISTLLAPHLSLYTNPYQQQQQQHQHQQSQLLHRNQLMPSANSISIEATHIPQTVSSWTVTTDLEDKSLSVVPPAMYISYTGTPEHIITKHTNAWKEKALQIEKDYKKTACDRERTRMRDMNRAFDLLRSKLPISKPNGKKYSKIESLRIAINYINHLQGLLIKDIPEAGNSQDGAVDYVVSTFQYQSRKSSYRSNNLEKEELEEMHGGSAWSDNSYVPNNGQQNQQWD